MLPAVRVTVPATSANLGPGFDALGLALALYDEVEVQADGSGAPACVEVVGEGAADLPRGEEHLVARAVRAALAAHGDRRPGLRLRCTNRLPHGRGLGSSAAAIVAGVLAGQALGVADLAGRDDDEALSIAARLEGHPDNVAACLLGGATVAWTDDAGEAHAVRLPVHPDIVGAVLVPPVGLATHAARALLPGSVPHVDAAANAARAALLVEALAHRPDLLLEATADRLHQGYRASAMPETAALVARLRRDGVAAVVSGAGPTVLALVRRGDAAAVVAEAPPGWHRLVLEVDREGAQLERIQPSEAAHGG